MLGNTRSSTNTLIKIKKKKSVLLVDGASDWLQIWTAASSFDIKGNIAIKKKFVLLTNRLVFLNTVTGITVSTENKDVSSTDYIESTSLVSTNFTDDVPEFEGLLQELGYTLGLAGKLLKTGLMKTLVIQASNFWLIVTEVLNKKSNDEKGSDDDADDDDYSDECPQVSHYQACKAFDVALEWLE